MHVCVYTRWVLNLILYDLKFCCLSLEIRPEFIVVAQTDPSTSQAQSPLIFSGD